MYLHYVKHPKIYNPPKTLSRRQQSGAPSQDRTHNPVVTALWDKLANHYTSTRYLDRSSCRVGNTMPIHTHTYQISKTGKVDQSKHTSKKEREWPLYKSAWPIKGHLNWKQEWVQVSLSTPLTRPCPTYVLWWKQQAGNIHIYHTYVRTK